MFLLQRLPSEMIWPIFCLTVWLSSLRATDTDTITAGTPGTQIALTHFFFSPSFLSSLTASFEAWQELWAAAGGGWWEVWWGGAWLPRRTARSGTRAWPPSWASPALPGATQTPGVRTRGSSACVWGLAGCPVSDLRRSARSSRTLTMARSTSLDDTSRWEVY